MVSILVTLWSAVSCECPLTPFSFSQLVSNTIAPVQVVRATQVAAIKSGTSPQTIGATSAQTATGTATFVLTPAITQQIVKQVNNAGNVVNGREVVRAPPVVRRAVLKANSLEPSTGSP